jgi:hypothetical protein
MNAYIDKFHGGVCAECPARISNQCPCALDSLLLLAVEAIESVDLN